MSFTEIIPKLIEATIWSNKCKMQFGDELTNHSGRKSEIGSDENKIEELEHVAIFGFDGKDYFHLSKQKYIQK